MKKFQYFILISLFGAMLFSWYAVFAEERHGTLTVAYLNIGQGDATLIDTPSGHQLLIDGGPNGTVLREIPKVIPFYDRFLDVVIATHPDKDHVSGLVDVMRRFGVGVFLESGSHSDNGLEKILDDTAVSAHAKEYLGRQGTRIDFGDGVVLDMLFPDRDTSAMETNMSSIVSKLTYGKTSFLFTGDSPQAIEQYLVGEYGPELDVDVLKLGHHGSRTSSSEIFLADTAPQYAVISAGKNNMYGHPHKEVLDLLAKLKIPYFNTADQGTIIFQSDGRTVVRK